MFFQNGLTGEAWGSWSLYTDSPLRALSPAQEAIAGTGGPFGDDFWDPAGITNGKSKEEPAGGVRKLGGYNSYIYIHIYLYIYICIYIYIYIHIYINI
jgi:hypothetical protein